MALDWHKQLKFLIMVLTSSTPLFANQKPPKVAVIGTGLFDTDIDFNCWCFLQMKV